MPSSRPDGLRLAHEREKRRLELRIEEKDREIVALRAALTAYNIANGTPEAGENAQGNGGNDLKQEEQPDDEDSDTESGPGTFCDYFDNIFRCSWCDWEVSDNLCQGCGTEHGLDDDDGDYEEGEEVDFGAELYRSVVTDHEALNPDRRLAPRGTTPTLEAGKNIRLVDIPFPYKTERRAEYSALLSRGATRAMCEMFLLEFNNETGIVAWADQDIFDAFSSPVMKQGDCWKIYLGRRVELSSDDLDGTQFIEDLLEEETVLESPGVWATRPAVAFEAGTEQKQDEDGEKMEEDGESDQEDEVESAEGDQNSESDDSTMDSSEAGKAEGEYNETLGKRVIAEDAELDEPYDSQLYNGPVIRTEEYDTTDDDPELENEVDYVPGLNWPKNGIDAHWDSEADYSTDISEDDELKLKVEQTLSDADHLQLAASGSGQVDAMMSDWDCTMSSVDSDFDEDEVLSGDEAAPGEARLVIATILMSKKT